MFADLKHIARSAQYHTLLSMTKMTIPTIIQRASAQGTVFSVKEKVRNGKPVFEVMMAQGNTAKTTFYDLATGEPAGGLIGRRGLARRYALRGASESERRGQIEGARLAQQDESHA